MKEQTVYNLKCLSEKSKLVMDAEAYFDGCKMSITSSDSKIMVFDSIMDAIINLGMFNNITKFKFCEFVKFNSLHFSYIYIETDLKNYMIKTYVPGIDPQTKQQEDYIKPSEPDMKDICKVLSHSDLNGKVNKFKQELMFNFCLSKHNLVDDLTKMHRLLNKYFGEGNWINYKCHTLSDNLKNNITVIIIEFIVKSCKKSHAIRIQIPIDNDNLLYYWD